VQFDQLFWLWFPQLSLLPEAGKQVFQLKLRPLQKSTNPRGPQTQCNSLLTHLFTPGMF